MHEHIVRVSKRVKMQKKKEEKKKKKNESSRRAPVIEAARGDLTLHDDYLTYDRLLSYSVYDAD